MRAERSTLPWSHPAPAPRSRATRFRRANGVKSKNPSLERFDRPLDIGALLERLYERYHRPEFIHPDPLEIVLEAELADRECAGLIASSFALGRVDLILTTVRAILAALGPPATSLPGLRHADLERLFAGFRYRFFGASHIAAFLAGIGECLRRYGSIEGCFRSCFAPGDVNLIAASERFVALLRAMCPGNVGILLSDPGKGSACKRLHLYFRWMVRHDAVDPGRWKIPPGMLVVPVDVHMLRVSRMLGFTARRQPDLKAAIEITTVLSRYCPEDPVRFDFSMTRLGIHPDLTYSDLYEGNLPAAQFPTG
jgi:uncharacterized protein (TIGR02757 family)